MKKRIFLIAIITIIAASFIFVNYAAAADALKVSISAPVYNPDTNSLTATITNNGARNMIPITLKVPAIKEPKAEMPRAGPARP